MSITHVTRAVNKQQKLQAVGCDFCPEVCDKAALFPGEAAELARSIGWTTVRTGKIGTPRKWACPECLKKKETFL